MSTRILWDRIDNVACLYDSVSGVAFGELFTGEESYEHAERFLDWLPLDARTYSAASLTEMRRRFLEAHPLIAA